MVTDYLFMLTVAGTFILAGTIKGAIGIGLPTVAIATLAATVGLCHCTLFNQIQRIQLILGRFCTLNYNISTGFTPQDLTPSELFQIASARVRSASRFAPAPSSDMA